MDRPDQLLLLPMPLPTRPSSASRVKRQPERGEGLRREGAQLSLPLEEGPLLRLVQGEGAGSGHAWGRLVPLPSPAQGESSLPSRKEITLALLQAGADLVAGRISVAGATAIREAAEEALRRLEEAQRDPASQPRFVRAARALADLRR